MHTKKSRKCWTSDTGSNLRKWILSNNTETLRKETLSPAKTSRFGKYWGAEIPHLLCSPAVLHSTTSHFSSLSCRLNLRLTGSALHRWAMLSWCSVCLTSLQLSSCREWHRTYHQSYSLLSLSSWRPLRLHWWGRAKRYIYLLVCLLSYQACSSWDSAKAWFISLVFQKQSNSSRLKTISLSTIIHTSTISRMMLLHRCTGWLFLSVLSSLRSLGVISTINEATRQLWILTCGCRPDSRLPTSSLIADSTFSKLKSVRFRNKIKCEKAFKFT